MELKALLLPDQDKYNIFILILKIPSKTDVTKQMKGYKSEDLFPFEMKW